MENPLPHHPFHQLSPSSIPQLEPAWDTVKTCSWSEKLQSKDPHTCTHPCIIDFNVVEFFSFFVISDYSKFCLRRRGYWKNQSNREKTSSPLVLAITQLSFPPLPPHIIIIINTPPPWPLLLLLPLFQLFNYLPTEKENCLHLPWLVVRQWKEWCW